MPRELSAKDKAFIAEKDRMTKQHRKEIAELGDRIIRLNQENIELHSKLQALEYIVSEYEAHFGMKAEEFKEHCDREKQAYLAFKKLMSLGEALDMPFGAY